MVGGVVVMIVAGIVGVGVSVVSGIVGFECDKRDGSGIGVAGGTALREAGCNGADMDGWCGRLLGVGARIAKAVVEQERGGAHVAVEGEFVEATKEMLPLVVSHGVAEHAADVVDLGVGFAPGPGAVTSVWHGKLLMIIVSRQ